MSKTQAGQRQGVGVTGGESLIPSVAARILSLAYQPCCKHTPCSTEPWCKDTSHIPWHMDTVNSIRNMYRNIPVPSALLQPYFPNPTVLMQTPSTPPSVSPIASILPLYLAFVHGHSSYAVSHATSTHRICLVPAARITPHIWHVTPAARILPAKATPPPPSNP